MKIVFLGDSITEGVGTSSVDKSFVSLIEKKLNCNVRNYGVRGTRIARQKVNSSVVSHDWDFQQRAKMLDKDADMVFVFGGTNDFGHGNATLGERDSNDPYTFWGAMNNLTKELLSVYEINQLCFILPLHRSDEENNKGLTLGDYVNIMKTVLKAKNISFLDFYDNGLPKPPNSENGEYFCDGIHPNDKGHKWMAEQIINKIKNDKN